MVSFVWIKTNQYLTLHLTVSPTDAWQKNSSMGDSSDIDGSTSPDEVFCKKK